MCLASVDKGQHGFSAGKGALASLSSLPGGSPTASVALPSPLFHCPKPCGPLSTEVTASGARQNRKARPPAGGCLAGSAESDVCTAVSACWGRGVLPHEVKTAIEEVARVGPGRSWCRWTSQDAYNGIFLAPLASPPVIGPPLLGLVFLIFSFLSTACFLRG